MKYFLSRSKSYEKRMNVKAQFKVQSFTIVDIFGMPFDSLFHIIK